MVFSSNGSTTTAIPILNNSHFFICRENIRKAKLPPPAIFVGFQSRFRKFTLPPFKRTYFLSSPFHTSPVKKDNSTGNNWSWVSQRLINHVENTHVSRFIWFMSCGGIFQNWHQHLIRHWYYLTSSSTTRLTKLNLEYLIFAYITFIDSLFLQSLRDCHRISILILKVQPWKLLATRFFLVGRGVWS